MQTQTIKDDVENPQQGMEDIVTPNNFVKENQNILTEPQLRWLIRQRDVNGLKESGSVILIGRRFYIQKSKFIKWFASQSA